MSEREKKIIRLGVWLLRKKLGESASVSHIHDDMLYCGNPVIKKITEIINKSANLCKEDFQKKTVTELSELGLWICYKDTAYRDMFFWILNEMLEHADELKKELKPYVKEPKDWYVNVWHEGKKDSQKKRESGEIPFYAFSETEKVFSKEIQRRRLNKIAKKNFKQR